MQTNPATLAEGYYTLIGEKNVEGIKKYLHDEVEFQGPLASLKGKEAVLSATHKFMEMITSLTIRAKFGAEDQAMIVYNVDIPGVADNFPGASLVSFRDGLIIKIELFYDGSRVTEKKEELFNS